jgi:hypothetical protein
MSRLKYSRLEPPGAVLRNVNAATSLTTTHAVKLARSVDQ